MVEGTTPEALAAGTTRVMDCIDCHNAVAHRISPTAERAVDRAIASGQISPKLPFVRREGVRLVKSDYASEEEALSAIDSGLRAFYKEQAARSIPRRCRRRSPGCNGSIAPTSSPP